MQDTLKKFYKIAGRKAQISFTADDVMTKTGKIPKQTKRASSYYLRKIDNWQDFPSITAKARGPQCNFQSRILHPTKLAFKCESHRSFYFLIYYYV